MKISVIVPAYNEEKTIEEILAKVLVQESLKNAEVIVVDDGSKDKTSKVVEKMMEKYKNLHLVKCRVNKGKGRAVIRGIKKSSGDILVIQDADLEYNPQNIKRLITPILNKKAVVVYGTRLKTKPVFFGKNKTPFLIHFYGNKFISGLTSILYGSKITDIETGHKALLSSALKGIKLNSKGFEFEAEITAKLLKKGIKIKEIKIKTIPRSYKEGKKVRAFRDGIRAVWTLLKYRLIT